MLATKGRTHELDHLTTGRQRRSGDRRRRTAGDEPDDRRVPRARRRRPIAAVQSGVATQYWDQCLAIRQAARPVSGYSSTARGAPTTTRRATKDIVQRAFLGTGSVVRVWYSGASVVGLVVSGS